MTTHQEKVIAALTEVDTDAGKLASEVYGKFNGNKAAFRIENAAGAKKLDKAVNLALDLAKRGHSLSSEEIDELKEGFQAAKEFLQKSAPAAAPTGESPANPQGAAAAGAPSPATAPTNPTDPQNNPQNPTTPTLTPLEVAAQELDKTIADKTNEWATEENAAKRAELKTKLDELKAHRKDLQKLIDESKPKEKSEGIDKLEDTVKALNSAIAEAQSAWIAEKDLEKQKPLKARLDALQAELREAETKLAAAKRTDNQEETAEQRATKAAEREEERKKKEEERKAEQAQREKDRKAEQEKREAEQRIREQVTYRESEVRKLSNLISSNRDVRDAERGILLSPVNRVKRDLMRSEATKYGVPFDSKDSWEIIFNKIIDKKVKDRFPAQTKADETAKDPNEE
jgi:hypothetical protein